MRKILIELELDESFEAYFETETDMVNSILAKPQENYKWRLVKKLNLQNVINCKNYEINSDLDNEE